MTLVTSVVCISAVTFNGSSRTFSSAGVSLATLTEDKQGAVGWYSIRVSDPDRAEQVAAKVDEEFANWPYETGTETEGAFVKAFAEQIGDVGAIIQAILAAVFFTILLVAGNTMAQALRERTRELGVLKAVGYSDGQVAGFGDASSRARFTLATAGSGRPRRHGCRHSGGSAGTGGWAVAFSILNIQFLISPPAPPIRDPRTLR